MFEHVLDNLSTYVGLVGLRFYRKDYKFNVDCIIEFTDNRKPMRIVLWHTLQVCGGPRPAPLRSLPFHCFPGLPFNSHSATTTPTPSRLVFPSTLPPASIPIS